MTIFRISMREQPTTSIASTILLIFTFNPPSDTESFSILPSYTTNNSSSATNLHHRHYLAATDVIRQKQGNNNNNQTIRMSGTNNVVTTHDFNYIGTDLEGKQANIEHTSSCIHNDENYNENEEEDGNILSALFGSVQRRDAFFNTTYGRRVAYFPRSSVAETDEFGVILDHEKSLEAPILGIDLPSLYTTNEWTSLRKQGSRDMLDKTTMSYQQMSEYIEGGGSIIIPITPDDYLFPTKLKVERALGMEEETGTSMNIYHSGPDAVALNVHYDAYPVFVLQLVGRKDWMVQDDAFGQTVTSITRWKNLTMMEGDLLYIPQGVFHAATTAEGCDASTHATIGLI